MLILWLSFDAICYWFLKKQIKLKKNKLNKSSS